MVCGEHSGDNLGSGLMRELKTLNSNFSFFGIGGNGMIDLGLQSFSNIEDLNVIGLVGALLKYRKLKKIANGLVQEAIERNCKTVILIDYPGFNLALAGMLKKQIKDIKVIFYVSPQIWAWRYNRIYKISKLIDLMLLLFPFEKKIYDKHGIPNKLVGHTVVNNVKLAYQSGTDIPLPENSYPITIMPGSRSSEVKRLLDPILESSMEINKILREKQMNPVFLLPNINIKEESLIREKIDEFKKIDPTLNIVYIFNNSARAIALGNFVILSSGTATLEVAMFEKPMIILYKNSFFTHFIGKRVVSIPYIGLVNILSESFICKEFLQEECNPNNIVREAMKIIEDKDYRLEMVRNIQKVKMGLGDGRSSQIAAGAIVELISSSPESSLS
ncbi:MAG: lipid-A-disaccharide synthase [Leptospiraceae bacterium]|nr:lipid-A-disaccharide synthase [Leptospiraceae bacterium]